MSINTAIAYQGEKHLSSSIVKDLRRHVCSFTVLAYRYQISLPHLLSPDLAKVRDLFLASGQELRNDIALLTRRIKALKGTPVSSVEEIEDRSYLPVLLGEHFVLKETLRKQRKAEQRLGLLLGHTARLVRKRKDATTLDVINEVLGRSGAREVILSSLSFQTSPKSLQDPG